MLLRRILVRVAALLALALVGSGVLPAYSVLTHEVIVDLLWVDEIKPLVILRFPGLTGDQIKDSGGRGTKQFSEQVWRSWIGMSRIVG
jgi:hypothetical protein